MLFATSASLPSVRLRVLSPAKTSVAEPVTVNVFATLL